MTILRHSHAAEVVMLRIFNCYVENATEANQIVVDVKYTTELLVPIAVIKLQVQEQEQAHIHLVRL
jgi:hypothetical protein